MRPLPLLVVPLVATATLLPAQANCNSSGGPARPLATMTPFAGTHLYGHPNYPAAPGASYTGLSFLFDMTVVVPIDITQIDIDLYDDGGTVGLGGGATTISPNQIGGTANIELYIYPTGSWVGFEANPSVWSLLGAGTLTVAARHTHSQGIFSSPINLPVGTWGLAFKVDQTTTGPNPGPLHPMVTPGSATAPAPATFSDSAITISNLQFNRETWAQALAPPYHWQALEFHYNLAPGLANWTSFGSGCVAAPNVLALTSRPIIGTTITFETSNITAGTLFNFWAFGFTPDPNGINLTSYGMPGCNLYMPFGTIAATNMTGVSAGVSTVPLPIPNDPNLSGTVLYGQAAPLTAGVNSVGLLTSNAICIAVGIY